MTALLPILDVQDAVILCGKSHKDWAKYPELAGRHCIRPAGHEGFHISQRDDETHLDTLKRCAPELYSQLLQNSNATPHDGTPAGGMPPG